MRTTQAALVGTEQRGQSRAGSVDESLDVILLCAKSKLTITFRGGQHQYLHHSVYELKALSCSSIISNTLRAQPQGTLTYESFGQARRQVTENDNKTSLKDIQLN